MIKLEDIINAYKMARSNKRRSPDAVEFELHWEANCVRLWNQVINHEVRPTAYTFIAKHPRPREVFASDMATRVLHHYLDIRIRPLLESRMSNRTFNNRIGMGQNACQNAVISDIYEVSEGFTNPNCWVIKMDMTGCFPNINQDIAYKQLEEVILSDYRGEDKDELLYILQVCVYSYPTHHCYRKSSLSDWDAIPDHKSLFHKPDGIGAAIGHLIWQNAVNYYFNDIDQWMLSLGLHYSRFVDDLYFVVNDKAFLLFIPEIRKKLAEVGAKLHPHKFYCQHYTKGVECLGVHIKMDRVYPNRKSIRKAETKEREFNRCIRPQKINTILSSMNSYLGICKNGNGYNQARKIISLLSPKWFNYIHFNSSRCCLQANNGYRTNQQIINKFKLA